MAGAFVHFRLSRTASEIFEKVIGTGLLGWLLNIVLMLCSGPL